MDHPPAFQHSSPTHDDSIHPFNVATPNTTVIQCEGSDSGVEVLDPPTLATYEETFNLLVRRNSTLLEHSPMDSENGSESSSLAGNTRKKAGKATPKVTPRRPATNRRAVEPRPRPSSSSRTPTTALTPTDDGRWPSVNSKPAPRIARSMIDAKKSDKVVEKYATLPRRKKEKEEPRKAPREESINRLAQPKKATPATLPKKRQKVRIYHETGAQTALTTADIEKALAGLVVTPANPHDVEMCDRAVQVDDTDHAKLLQDYAKQSRMLQKMQEEVRQVNVEKQCLQEELQVNSQRVSAILGNDTPHSDSLLVLESRFQNVSQILLRQEQEITRLNTQCRSLQLDLDKARHVESVLQKQQRELESEHAELQEFMQAEKNTLTDALRETETELRALRADKEKLGRVNDYQWQESMGLRARVGVLEAQLRDRVGQQESEVGGARVALRTLIGRLDGLVGELVTSYRISEQELDDVIYHNEAYSKSNSPTTPTSRSTSPKKGGSSFISAVVKALKSAATLRDHRHQKSSPSEYLDSETEPCLMMEPVLEDVFLPDGHTYNMVSSCHSLPAINDFDTCVNRSNGQSSLVDQVIEVDNVITRLLKVIRIIQMDTEDLMEELHEQSESYVRKIDRQQEAHKMAAVQLKEWEALGGRLKAEVAELMRRLATKNDEVEATRNELCKERQQVEKLGGDVCELSTALAKAQMDEDGDRSGVEGEENELTMLKASLADKERRLSELTQEFQTSRQVLTESWREAVTETRRQYETIDNALEILHNNEKYVQQCPPLAEMQRQLETSNFQSASSALVAPSSDVARMQAISNLEINSTA